MNHPLFYGLRRSLSIAVGYAPVALTFGLLAVQYQIPVWQAGLMSLLVFAGASQFIAIQMLHSGADIWTIALTTLIVNVRHVLMSLAVLPYFPGTSRRWFLALAQGLTDETFVLNSRLLQIIEAEADRRWVMLGVQWGAFASWAAFTFIGGLVGQWLPVNFSGFQFALLALFVMLTAATLNRSNLATYLIAALLAVLFKSLLPGKLYLVASVLLAAAGGAWLRGFSAYRQRPVRCTTAGRGK